MDRFTYLKDKRDKFLSMYVIVLHDITVQEVIDLLYKKLEELKRIKDTYKRGYVNDRIFSLVTDFKSNRKTDDIVSEVIFLGPKIESSPLASNELVVLREWKIPNFMMHGVEFFDLEFLQDLLYNTDYDEVIKVSGNKLTHMHVTPTKRKVVGHLEEKSMDIAKYVSENVIHPTIIHGVSSSLKGLKLDGHVVIGKELEEEQLRKELTKLRMTERLNQLRKVFDMFANPSTQGKIVVGKSLQQAIICQMIETLIATPEIVRKVKERYSEFINFKIIEIVTIDDNPDVKRLHADFGGAIGIKYY